MNIKTNEAIYSASMLVTRNGYLVKVHKKVSSTHYEKICFFVDNDFNFRIWKLTETRGMFLLANEFYALRSGRGNEQNRLAETSLITAEQWEKAIQLAEIISVDPYHGLDEKLKAKYAKEGMFEKLEQWCKTFKIAPEDMKKFKPAINTPAPPITKMVIAEKPIQVTKAAKKVASPEPKKAVAVAPIVTTIRRRAKVINDFIQLAMLSGAFA
jgi:hypothetical protein